MNVTDINHGGDHWSAFICEDCQSHVSWAGYWDGLQVCNVCRFIREHPDIPDHVKNTLRYGE